jgi:MYXO-CTERM domain-containing protein
MEMEPMTCLRIAPLIVLLLLAAGCMPACAQEPSVIVSDCTVTPAILMPGDKGMVRVTLTNTALSAVETESLSYASYYKKCTTANTEINPTVESVFLDGRGDIKILGGNSQFAGDLGPGQSVSLAFLVEAPAKDGIFFPVLHVRIRGAESVRYPVPVNVNVPIAALKTPALILTPPPPGFVAPGSTCAMNLSLANAGESAAADVLVRIPEHDGSLAPAGAAAFHLGRLAPGQQASLPLRLLVAPDAHPGVHTLPLEIACTRVDGTRSVQQERVALDVRGVSALGITSLKTDPARIAEGDPLTLVIRLENTGTGEAESAVATIDLPFPGGKEAFIGTIRPGNDAPAVFTLTAGPPGEYACPLTVHFRDDWGEHTLETTLHLTVDEAGGVPGGIALLALLGVAGAAGYRYRVRRREG